MSDPNLFELLGLSPRYDLDAGDLRRKYLAVARACHPDRAGTVIDEAESDCLRTIADVNHAFDVLGDPVRRADYLLKLAGGSSAADDKTVAPEVLAQTLMLREEIDEARASDDEAALDRIRADVRGRLDDALAEIASMAQQLPGAEALRSGLRMKLNGAKYYQRLLEQL